MRMKMKMTVLPKPDAGITALTLFSRSKLWAARKEKLHKTVQG